jgi:hypothetical protein
MHSYRIKLVVIILRLHFSPFKGPGVRKGIVLNPKPLERGF